MRDVTIFLDRCDQFALSVPGAGVESHDCSAFPLLSRSPRANFAREFPSNMLNCVTGDRFAVLIRAFQRRSKSELFARIRYLHCSTRAFSAYFVPFTRLANAASAIRRASSRKRRGESNHDKLVASSDDVEIAG
ncbi:hypothetical protein X777_02284 [Ooceraea biroi]|uniref:Uncharacterized protein n=1 Tax=Ooceraea biroi TaxID=2015173 RepID=A0A026WKX6_OOCBI|nr:hypothetical protein X777_02284 [Ooceraea biroi]